jgi:hypothetical protein
VSASTTHSQRTPRRRRCPGITDYASYPGFNPSVTHVTVLRKDGSGAEFLAGRKTKIGKQAHAFDRYDAGGSIFRVGRTCDGIDGSSARAMRPAGEGRSTLTINGTMKVSLPRGLVLKLALKRILYGDRLQAVHRRGRAARYSSRARRAA